MRSSNFLMLETTKVFSRSKHKSAVKLLEEVDKYATGSISARSKLLKKVSVLMSYNGLHDLIEDGSSDKRSDLTDEVTLACKRFPSISLGSSPPVELYDESTCSEMRNHLATQSGKELLFNSMHAEWFDPDGLPETWCPPYPVLENVNSSVVTEENTYGSPQSSKFTTLDSERSSDSDFSVDKSQSSMQIDSQEKDTSVERYLDREISCIPGLNKRQYRQLESCNFHTIRKLLQHFPRTYADLRNAQVDIDDGQYLIFIGEVLSSRGIKASSSFAFLEVVVGCEIAGIKGTSGNMTDDVDSGGRKRIYLHLMKFFRGTRFTYQPFLKILAEKHKVGELVCVSGKVKARGAKDHFEMREYSIDVLDDEKESSSLQTKGRPYPIYPSKGGLSSNFLRDNIARALQDLPANVDPIPREISKSFKLPSLRDAYIGIHQPKTLEEAEFARKRLIFDEFFYLQLGRLFQMLDALGTKIEKDGLLDKYRKPELNALYVDEWSGLTKAFLNALPYTLTSSQLSAASEIIWDLKRRVPMNRLLQGDVGCGKTVVAFLACMEVMGSGYQAAFMVPTELLAVQHYEHLRELIEKMEFQSKPSVALLTGSTPSKQSRMIRKDLLTGDVSMVIGTQSLIADSVEFSALRISVVDEQHRFGVIQRGRFNSKLYTTSMNSRTEAANTDVSSECDISMAPHVLAMSATPIPRTLALALYGDVSLTQITDLPPGRIPVQTHVVEGNDHSLEEVYMMMLDELKTGGKVYVVYPVIKQSEQLPQLRAASSDFETIQEKFPDYCCGLLHGKMKSDEKDEALRRFRSGDTRILLSTQVIEVGVDVPDASMMVVMNAERFGIAQLHQLRGRVGRGVRESKCILIGSTVSSLSRLNVLGKSSDGFYLANMDLLLRGPGDLLGRKQSGHLPEFPIARLEIDGNILQDAHIAALKILGDSHDLEKYPALKAELSMRQPLCVLGD